jgi:hypothetical protein
MSYRTHVEFEMSDEPDPPPVGGLVAAAQAHLQADGRYNVNAVLSVLLTLFTDGTADFNHLTSRDFEPLVRALSAAYPSVRFTVRGTGEEMPDLWLRQCEAGQVVYSVGPFDAE